MGNMGWFSVGFRMICWLCFVVCVGGIGANWGTQTSHPIPPNTVVQMLKNNGFQKVKLFDADEGILNALKRSGLEVMVGIPNDMLAVLAASTKAAQNWVSKNVSEYINDGVNIRCFFFLRFCSIMRSLCGFFFYSCGCSKKGKLISFPVPMLSCIKRGVLRLGF